MKGANATTIFLIVLIVLAATWKSEKLQKIIGVFK